MLKKSHISAIKSGSDEWHIARLGKLTSSENHNLAYPTGFTDGAMNYLRRKVGEELTRKPAKPFFETDATRHGLFFEAEAVKKFGQKMGLGFVVVQQLICDPEGKFGSTPDGLIVLRESPDGSEYEVITLEVKCPPSFDAYIELFECDYPWHVKKVAREYYWQVIDQMDQCQAKEGYLVIYHPDFKAGNMKVIHFKLNMPLIDDYGMEVRDKKMGRIIFPVHEDMKLLKERKEEALKLFDKIRSKLMAVPAI